MEKSNFGAKEAYKKNKMFINGEKLYGYDFIFEGFPTDLKLQEEIPEKYTFREKV